MRSRLASRVDHTCSSWPLKRYAMTPSCLTDEQLETLYSKTVEVEERIIPEWHEFLATPDQDLIQTPSGVTIRRLTPLSKYPPLCG